MTNPVPVPVSTFPAAGALDGTEIAPVVKNGVTSRTTTQDIADLAVGDVVSVNGQTGVVVLTAADVGALSSAVPVPIASGGTGQTSANAALNALLPSQTTHAGQVLKTDGTNTSWVADANEQEVSIGKSMSATYTPTISNPTALTWNMMLQMRPMELACPRLQYFYDDMMQDCGFYTASGDIGTFTYSQSQVSLASTVATFGNGMNLTTKQRFESPMWYVSIEDIHRTTDANANVLGCGVIDGTNSIFAFMETGGGTNNNITLAKIFGAAFTAVATTTIGSLPSGITGLAISSSGQGTYYVWMNVSNLGWVPVLSATINNADMMNPAVLATYNPFITVTGGVTDKWKVGAFRTGITGQGWMRDFRVVTLLDGTPYISDGYLYFTATTDNCAVYRMNPKNGVFEKTGSLLFVRSGTRFADLNGDILYDPDNDLWHVFWATWGSNSFTSIRMFHATYKGDILNGFHLITGGTQLTLSQTSGNNATYDASVVYDAANSRWLMAYTLSPGGTFGGNFYAVLDQSTDLVTWTNVWAKSGTTGYEGTWINCIGGTYFVTAGNGSNFRCWNLAGTDLGTLTVSSFPSPGSDPPPHFIGFPWTDGGITEYYSLSWQNTQFSVNGVGAGVFATGTPILYKATTTETGFEFDAIGIR